MAKKNETPVEEIAEESTGLISLARKVMLATVGAVALAQEEAETFIQKLIDRGEIAEKDGRKLISDLQEKRKAKVQAADEELDARVTSVLERMNVPTKSDIDDLSAKITALTEKIDELKEA